MAPSHEDHAAAARRWRRCQCGAPMQPAANFCPSCGLRHFQDSEEGRSLESLVAAGIRCVCGADFVAEDRFCQSCGQERLVGDAPAARRSAGAGQRAVGTLDLPTPRRLVQPLQLRSSPRCPTGVHRVSPGRSSQTYSPRMGESNVGCSDSEEDSGGGGDSMIMLSSRFSVESERRGHQTEALMLDNEELHDTVRGLQRQLQSYAVETQSLREELLEVQGSWRVDLLRQVQGFWKDDAGEFYGGACVEFSENGWRVHESSLHLRSKTARSEAMLGSAVYTWRIEPPRIVLHEQRQDGGECRELVLTVGGQGLLVVRCPVESSVWNLTPDSRRSALSPFGRASRSPGARVPPSSCGTPASPCSPSMAAGDGEEVPGHEPLEAEEVRRLREELAEGEWKLREAEGCVAQYQQALAENSELRAALQHERERSATRLSRISSLEQDVEAFSSWGPPQAAAETARGSGHKRPSLAAELASFHGGPGEEELGGDLQAELHRLRDFARRHEQAAEARGACGQAPAAEPRPPAGGEATPGSEPEPDMAEVLSLMGQLGQLAGAFHSFGAAPPGAHRG